MNDERAPDPNGAGVVRLPAAWASLVHLVGTFGLAVFLVLYYVLVMQPRDQARYEELREAVASLTRIVGSRLTLLTPENAERLEELYLLAVAPEIVDRIERVLPERTRGPVPASQAERLEAELARVVEEVLLVRAGLLRGLRREQGGALSDVLARRVATSGVAAKLAREIVVTWPRPSREELLAATKEALFFALRDPGEGR